MSMKSVSSVVQQELAGVLNSGSASVHGGLVIDFLHTFTSRRD